ncbi:3-dehydroquinate synthase [Flagellimonas zhangzhouensis]|uniref:3-dehydroquinate synthase n=1 Tax=Flagellimonas zhangzhouensis TaxID=1073328 RepID=A0A1H2XW33_9FLAO|nr:3-dehydroquinate synthase [Allomuricauda zhangzhouensis]SDQ92353.1 3-dehydroquinate synthase [Allomuricauda zhangzhouensis]SDW97076.1 3-dehydroquinate synthase [Allomuricauda zhangzhouensis]
MDISTLPTIQQEFNVRYTYQLLFTQHLFALENPLFKNVLEAYRPNEPIKCQFVVDQGVFDSHSGLEKQIQAYCDHFKHQIQFTELIVVPGGEDSKKDQKSVDKCLEGINNNAICRHSFVVAIGGGAVVDMVGYAATIAHRGVQLIRIPTTVLSQNDAAVGVKNSVNAFGKKNFLGTFAIPYAIINDLEFLKTLEQRDWVAGIAEAVKVALIKDKTFFEYIEANAEALAHRELEPMAYLIHRCAELHMEHISKGGDPFEKGSSRPLDFGHWSAHKLEYMTQYQVRHGEAVAIGMAMDMVYAKLIGVFNGDLDRILSVLKKVGFDLDLPLETDSEIQELLKGIEEFREHLGGELTITLIPEIGKKTDVHTIDYKVMEEAARSFMYKPQNSL